MQHFLCVQFKAVKEKQVVESTVSAHVSHRTVPTWRDLPTGPLSAAADHLIWDLLAKRSLRSQSTILSEMHETQTNEGRRRSVFQFLIRVSFFLRLILKLEHLRLLLYSACRKKNTSMVSLFPDWIADAWRTCWFHIAVLNEKWFTSLCQTQISCWSYAALKNFFIYRSVTNCPCLPLFAKHVIK